MLEMDDDKNRIYMIQYREISSCSHMHAHRSRATV